ncbi:MAG: alpha-D-ribose 1-methylphosphonate 5-triphosphate diphosphatase [Spirochaetes bacterium]|nr:alpha-D-ribose 1-methylphosphonate 5-triphosphate diphosphatase [Spirochaetota bacterium]
MSMIFTNAHIITPLKDFIGTLILEDGLITDIIPDKFYFEGKNCNQSYICPGIIDIHSDYLEREISPRPNTGFSYDLALRYLDYRAVTCGITSLFNGISYREDEGAKRSVNLSLEIGRKINSYIKEGLFLINHFIHARLDTTTKRIFEVYDEIIEYESLKMAVFNDHTPGTRQFRDIKKYKEYASDRSGMNSEELDKEIIRRQNKAKETKHIRPLLSEKFKDHNIVLGSHDDTTVKHIKEAVKDRCSLSEFPTTMEAARSAKENGLYVCMGATNLILGKSQSGNISCKDAVNENFVDALCSDYHLPSMLSSIIYLSQNGKTLSESVNYVTLNPAKIVNMDKLTGSIEKGKNADIIIFDKYNSQPILEEVYVNGILKFKCDNPVKKEKVLCS